VRTERFKTKPSIEGKCDKWFSLGDSRLKKTVAGKSNQAKELNVPKPTLPRRLSGDNRLERASHRHWNHYLVGLDFGYQALPTITIQPGHPLRLFRECISPARKALQLHQELCLLLFRKIRLFNSYVYWLVCSLVHWMLGSLIIRNIYSQKSWFLSLYPIHRRPRNSYFKHRPRRHEPPRASRRVVRKYITSSAWCSEIIQHLQVTAEGSEPKCAYSRGVASNPQVTLENKPETCQNIVEKYPRTVIVAISPFFSGHWNPLQLVSSGEHVNLVW
jgi:hypothetical protein